MSRKSNPINYHIPQITDQREIPRRVKHIKLVYASLRKQARAAYVHYRDMVTSGGFYGTLKEPLKRDQCHLESKIAMTLKGLDHDSARLEDILMKSETLALERADPKNWYFTEQLENIVADFNSRLKLVNPQIEKAVKEVKLYQDRSYGHHRQRARDKKSDNRVSLIPTARGMRFDIFKELKQRYPHISAKNKPRLIRLYTAWWKVAGRFPKAEDIRPIQLVEAGIPAAEVVGPWFNRTKTIKSPMDWIREKKDLTAPGNNRSPLLQSWLHGIGMDEHDRALVDSVSHYWHQHKAVPSVEWVRRRNNELEEERRKQEIEGQLPDVESWLKCSREWRKEPEMVDIPEMPDPTFRIVEPKDAKMLCERAKKDGLCVIDVICNQLMEEDPHGDRPEDVLDEDDLEAYNRDPVFERSKAEGVCTLIISTDPHRRTVVGLNEKGVCTSEHHCTGKNNEVDMVAWEYFRKR